MHGSVGFWVLATGTAWSVTRNSLCLSLAEDGYSHYSLAVHGCRISFLYWPLLESARPVKFLWKLEQVRKGFPPPRVPSPSASFADPVLCCLPQVCDDEWHHYALNLEFPTVTLYVDGVSYDPALIHDNGLIHPPRPEPSIMIGACWTGECPLPKPCSSHVGKEGVEGDPEEVKETPPNAK